MQQRQLAPFDIGSNLKIGLLTLGALVLGALLWGIFAPLESAAIAPGRIMVSSYAKVVQHLEGGIVKKIYVQEGSVVKENDVLIELDQTQPKANVELYTARYNSLAVLQARLIAQRDNADHITFPPELLAQIATNPDVKGLITTQENEFQTYTKNREGTHNILNQRIGQIMDEINSLQSQVEASDEQLQLINKELVSMLAMAAKHFVSDSDVYKLQREAARLKGDRDENIALIAQAKQHIDETKLQIIQQDTQDNKDTLSQLRDTEKSLSDAQEQKKAADDVLARTVIRAPRSGTVINLTVHTIDAVIKPGETIMNVIPNQDRLVVEARVSPLDIDVVKVGLAAKIRLTAYKTRSTPTFKGHVFEVSADAITDPKTGKDYYLVRILIDKGELAAFPKVTLYPGMPAEVMIITSKHSFFSYLMTPVLDSLNRAFRAQ